MRFKSLFLATSTLAVAALVMVMFVGFVSAEIIAEQDFIRDAVTGFVMTSDYDGDGYVASGPTAKAGWVYMKNAEDFYDIQRITLRWDADRFKAAVDGDGNTLWSYWEDNVEFKKGGTVNVGHIAHGYSYTDDREFVDYVIYFHDDIDFTAYDGTERFSFAVLSEDYHFTQDTDIYPISRPGVSDGYVYSYGLDDGELLMSCSNGLYVLGNDSDSVDIGDPDHYYSVVNRYNFSNRAIFEDVSGVSGLYKLTIQREDLPGFSGSVSSMFTIYDSGYVYAEQDSCRDVNETIYVFDTCCDWLVLNCTSSWDVRWSYNRTDLCDVPEPGYFNLSGYTRSVYGNLVPGVLLTAQDNAEYSNNISFYEFEDLDTGSFDLAWNKTGYLNDSVLMYIESPGDYQRDVYLIPLDALDAGEFGGVVYDFCTHKSIQGAYIYLFNETADSGKYTYSNKYGFYRFAGMTEGLDYEVSASKDGYDASIVHSFTFNESNVNETHCKTKSIWLLPEDGCPEDGGIPTPPPAPTPTPHEWTNEEIVSWLRVNLKIGRASCRERV